MEVADTWARLRFQDYLDQSLGGSSELLSLDAISQLHSRYRQITSSWVADDVRPSDAQLSALAARVKPQKDGHIFPPYAEFAVFGPI